MLILVLGYCMHSHTHTSILPACPMLYTCIYIYIPVASKQLQEVTLRLVKESFGDTYYDKALDCVKALRSEAVTVSWNVVICCVRSVL